MKTLFQYNWQVRDDWFSWCEAVPEEELLKARIGGVGGFLRTLFHIVDVEYSWIRTLKGEPDFQEPFEAYSNLEKIRDLSTLFHTEVEHFVMSWTPEMEYRELEVRRSNGELSRYKFGEITRHVIAHEIHHIGQMSVWARELGRAPVTANLIRRGLFT